MKRFIVLICCIALGFVAKAQKLEGSVDVLLNESRVDFELSFAKASIHGMSEAEFANYVSQRTATQLINSVANRTIVAGQNEWERDLPHITGDFVDNLNEQIKDLVRFGKYPTAKYKLLVEVIDVTTHGNFDSDVYLLDKEGNTVAKITRLVAEGGKIGSKLNLIKDGARHSGEALGKFLYKTLKKAKKRK